MLCARPALALEDARRCDAAATRAESASALPAGILAAVGTVESGRRDAAGLSPWPWTVNAGGRGYMFATKADAVAGTLALMREGNPLIDLGCFQIDIMHHAGVFRSLDDAFDPDRNAIEAAKILNETRRRAPDWATAVAWYHSANPIHGAPYLDRVRSAFPSARNRAWAASMLQALETAATAGPLPQVIYGGPIPAPGRTPLSPDKQRLTDARR